MPEDSSTLLNSVVAVVFFGGLFALAFHLHTRVRRILETVASKRGLCFSEGGTSRVVFPSERAVPSIGRLISCRPEVRWRLEGEVEGVSVLVYKMVLRTGSVGQPNSRTWGYPRMIGRFVAPGVDLPRTLLRPRSFFGRLGRRAFSYSAEPLKTNPLSGSHCIETDSAGDFQRLFDDRVCGRLLAANHLTLEGFSNEFFLIEKSSTLRFLLLTEKSMESFLMLGVDLAKRIEEAGKTSAEKKSPSVAREK